MPLLEGYQIATSASEQQEPLVIVKNVKKTVKDLQKNGVKFEPGEKMGEGSKVEGPITSDSFGAEAFFKDSEGNLLMVYQYKPPM